MPTERTPPWRKKAPAKAKAAAPKTRLSAASIAWAKARAKKAGRRYPNLVDNMAAARREKEHAHKGGSTDHP